MNIKNEKGIVALPFPLPVTIAAVSATKTGVACVVAFKSLFSIVLLAAIWHIPAWDKAKQNHTEVQYQASEMWPQQVFDKLPGGGSHAITMVSGGNGGNFAGGNSGIIAE